MASIHNLGKCHLNNAATPNHPQFRTFMLPFRCITPLLFYPGTFSFVIVAGIIKELPGTRMDTVPLPSPILILL